LLLHFPAPKRADGLDEAAWTGPNAHQVTFVDCWPDDAGIGQFAAFSYWLLERFPALPILAKGSVGFPFIRNLIADGHQARDTDEQ
jgi:hypothetical protein